MTARTPHTSDATKAASAPVMTPMMVQYHALKQEAGDCLLFYRMGDFFEMFFDDARAAAQTLDIALTTRGEQGGQAVPMCGVPVHAAENYLARLIRAGHRVAIAEQVETPEQAKKRGGSKALVARAIVRFVTAGTLTEDALLDSKASNWLVALAQTGSGEGMDRAWAAVDISTGSFELGPARHGALAEIARMNPAEILVAEGADEAGFGADIPATLLHPRPRSDFDSQRGAARLAALYGVATLDGFGDFSRTELSAAGALIAWLDQAGAGQLPWLQSPRRRESSEWLLIDAATRDSLEITRSAQGGRAGSLLSAVDRTVTGAGARLLSADLSAPLAAMSAVNDRLDLVGWFAQQSGQRTDLRGILAALPDIGRALGRIVAGRGSPRDLGALRDGLDGARALREKLAQLGGVPALLARLLPTLDGHGALVDELARALVPAPPTEAASGGYIAAGYDAALDALRDTAAGGRRAIATLEASYRERTGITALKVRHNAVLGYHIEVTAKHADALMDANSGFTHRQTLSGVVRFNAADLAEEAARVVQAGSHALAAESAHLEALIGMATARADAIALSAETLARIDVSAALAERAVEGGWCRPLLCDDVCLEIEGGRHPVVESALSAKGDRFVSNDVMLSLDDRLWLVTGPNMGGKSTFLRQNALIILLAQAGSFVPANRAKLGMVDRLFSRVGASDNLARGRSTFMVEMVETAAILAQATPRSFVILDEVGRGTSTYDGLALAWAVVEAVHGTNRSRCLFATHYHELTRLAERLDALSLHHVRAREWRGDLVLLHEVADGPADRSYGLAVARLAGVPAPVLARAKDVLKRLEAGRAATGGLAAGLDDLPLFAALQEETSEQGDALRAALAAIDADALSPKSALDAIYALKALAASADED